MTILPATQDDAGSIASVHIASWRVAYAGIIPDDTLNQLDVRQRTLMWEATLAEADVRTLVVNDDRRIVGFASFARSRDREDDPVVTAEIQSLYVDPGHWRQGIGGQLLQAALTQLSALGFQDVVLWVLAANLPARRFYERAGFENDGPTKIVTIGVPLDVVKYRRSLASEHAAA